MQSQSLANLLRVIAVPKRLEIIQKLMEEKEGLPVCTIGACIGLSEGMTSGHLGRMAQYGLVLRSPQGRFAFYRLNHGLIKQIFDHFQEKGLTSP